MNRQWPAMVEIGIVGLDTSHAESYAMAIRNHPETSLAGVWDGEPFEIECTLEPTVNETERRCTTNRSRWLTTSTRS
ncbi:hypothetical protein ACFQMM_03415 [Saliphagus sp. GCM10025308]